MSAKPTLVLRCPAGHRLIRVIHESGKPIAYLEAESRVVRRGDDGELRAYVNRSMALRVDLEAEADDYGNVPVHCHCGTRTTSLPGILALIQSGRTGALISESPLIW